MFFSNIGNCRFNVQHMKYNPIFLLTSETTHFIERVVNRKKSSALDLSETHMLYYRRFVTADKNEPLQVLSVWDGMKRERFNLDSEMIPNAVDVRARCVSTTHFSVAREGRRACELSTLVVIDQQVPSTFSHGNIRCLSSGRQHCFDSKSRRDTSEAFPQSARCGDKRRLAGVPTAL